MIIFKTLLSKFVLTTLSKQLIEETRKIQKAFIWKDLTLKIKHEILCNSFEDGSLKYVDVNSKTVSLQRS